MSGALFDRVKVWIDDEDVVYSDLNAEFDNILNNFVPLMIDDYSANVTQMQTQTDPGEVGTESLATTLGGELARIRFILKEITGETYWYTSPDSSIAAIVNVIGTGLTPNRLVSGRTRSTSLQPLFLVPNGAARTATVKGATTNFIYQIASVQYTISSDLNITSLTAAPSTNNTCVINDSNFAAQDWTKFSGENGSEIPIGTIGSEITALVGKLAAFKLVNSSAATEYFIAEVGTNKLINARRGYFFDSTDAPVPRVVCTNGNTITLMKLSWIFATTSSTLTAAYTPPVWSFDEPSSPANGDYWYDMTNAIWKKYDVNAFVAANATLIGVSIQDATNTVGARSHEFFLAYSDTNRVEVVYDSAAQVRSRGFGTQLSSWGATTKEDFGNFVWNMTTDLDTGITEAASTWYYFYITQAGDEVISNIRPFDRRGDLLGYYHPHQSWRCVGFGYNDASSNLGSVESYYKSEPKVSIANVQAANSVLEVVGQFLPMNTFAGNVAKKLPPAAYWRGQVITGAKVSQDFNFGFFTTSNSEPLLDGTYAANATYAVNSVYLLTPGETVDFMSDGTNVYVKNRFRPYSLDAGKKIGYDSSVGSAVTMAANDLHASKHWARQNAVVTRIGIFFASQGSGKKVMLGIYANNASDLPGNKLAQIPTEYTTVAVEGGYKVFDLDRPVPIVKDTYYWFAVHSSSSLVVENQFISAGSGVMKYRTVGYSTTMPDPFAIITADAGGNPCMGGF